jgi:2-aminoadipate transaminase
MSRMAWVDPEVRQRLQAQTTQLWGAAGVVDLGIGQPQDALLPVEAMSRALAGAAAAGRRHPLQYGLERGDGNLRVALAEFLAERYGQAADPELMFVTNGNSHAIDLCCGVLTSPGDVVFVEEPTYFLALSIFRDHGLRVVGIPVDDEGLSIEALEDELSRHRPAFVYTIPAAHNPTGVTLTASRRARLVELALEHDFVVVADEVYHLLRYEGQPPAPLAADIGSGVVLSLGTFSKILAPGLRLGWVQAAEPLLRRLEARGAVVSGGGVNPLPASLVATMLDDGSVADYLDHLLQVFGRRVEVMDAAVREHLPLDGLGVTYRRPDAGYFFWLRFPEGVDTAAVRPRALALGAGFQPGRAFSTVGALPNYLRLSFAYYGDDDLWSAVAAIGQAFHEGIL